MILEILTETGWKKDPTINNDNFDWLFDYALELKDELKTDVRIRDTADSEIDLLF